MHAMIVRHYLHGGYYPVGGSWKIADSIIPKIQAGGGEVFTYARVDKILVEDGKVTGVAMQDGHRIECSCVISSAGVDNTFNHLLPAATVERSGYRRHMQNVQPSVAHLGVYIGLQHTAEELGIPKTNFWIYPSNDFDAAVEDFVAGKTDEFPVVYISFPSAKDPDFATRVDDARSAARGRVHASHRSGAVAGAASPGKRRLTRRPGSAPRGPRGRCTGPR